MIFSRSNSPELNSRIAQDSPTFELDIVVQNFKPYTNFHLENITPTRWYSIFQRKSVVSVTKVLAKYNTGVYLNIKNYQYKLQLKKYYFPLIHWPCISIDMAMSQQTIHTLVNLYEVFNFEVHWIDNSISYWKLTKFIHSWNR